MVARSFLHYGFLFLSLLLLASGAFAGVTAASVNAPMHFEANQGQTRDDVKFLARGPGYGVYLTANEAVLALSADKPQDCKADDATPESGRVLRMRLLGGAKAPAVHALDEQPGKANYLVGQDSSKWRTNILTYAKVRYSEVYPGTDLVYYGNERQLEYDFVLAPGADPRKIELQFDGADRVEIDANGDLVLHACGREIRQAKPVVYQEAEGRRDVSGSYVRKGKNRVGFKVAAYDRSLPLVIDPLVIAYATFLGGTKSDDARAVAVDTHGSAYLTGTTYSVDFPVTAGAYQRSNSAAPSGAGNAFVVKFDSAGSLVYSTYLGGSTAGSFGTAIAVDLDGNAYVTGAANGQFVTTPGAFQETSLFGDDGRLRAFVTKLNSTGSALLYSTLLGGHDPNRGGAITSGIAIDLSGSAYVTGGGRGLQPDFPTTPGAFQQPDGTMFVAKLNAAGSGLDYSSRFGGYNTTPAGIALDHDGNAYVAGTTTAATFPTTPGAFNTTFKGGGAIDEFVTKMSPVGQLVYSTTLGMDGGAAAAIAVDSSGSAYVAGHTAVGDYPSVQSFPTTPRAYRPMVADGFLTKLNPSGSGLIYATFLSGAPRAIALDAAGRAYIVEVDYPQTSLSVVEPSGSWVNRAVIRSWVTPPTPGGAAIGLNLAANANLWIVGSAIAPPDYSPVDFPVTPDAYQSQPHFQRPGDPSDAVAMKLALGPATVPGTIDAASFDEGGEGPGYHENTPGNQGDAGFRMNEDVDIFVSNDVAGDSPYIVKNFESGEWLAYTINVPADGQYTLELRASTNFHFPNSSYYAQIDGANVTGIVVLPQTGGWDHYQWIGKKTFALTAGLHVLTIVSEAPYFGFEAIRMNKASVTAPYYNAPASIPGEIEAETFDAGGEGPGYHEHTAGNQGDAYFRTGEDVDVFVSNDYGSGSWYVVKNFETDEWLAYTIDVSVAGDYDIELRAATSPDFPNAAYYAVVDNQNVFFGTQALPNTGGFDTYQWIGKKTVTLAAGIHLLKIVSAGQYFNLNTIRITPTAARASRAYYGAPMAVPGVLEAEAFDNGGEGFGYHDNAPGNQGNAGARYTEDVDIFVTNDATSGSPYIVKNFEAGEWLSYTLNVSSSDNYDVELRAATNPAFPNSAYHLQIDGMDATGSIVLSDTGSWDNYQWIGKRTIPLSAGAHVLTVVVDQPYFGFNSLRLLRSSP